MQPGEFIPLPASELSKPDHSADTQIEKQHKSSEPDHCPSNETNKQSLCSETCEPAAVSEGVLSSEAVEATEEVKERNGVEEKEEKLAEDDGRERLKRHRVEVAGRVWIPEIWGQEKMLKDWIDCSAFDSSLVPTGIMSARAALVQEGGRANSGGLRIENRC